MATQHKATETAAGITEEMYRESVLRAKGVLTTEEEQFLRAWITNGPTSLPLTEQERQAVIEMAVRVAIAEAEAQKGRDEYKRLYVADMTAPKTYPKLSYEDMQKFIMDAGALRARDRNWKHGFVIDKSNTRPIKLLCMYFADDVRFEQAIEGYSLKKGLMLIGNTGCGKTQLMELLSRNSKACFTRHDCADISREFSAEGSGGVAVIDHYASNNRAVNPDHSQGHEFLGRFFDDLGSEGVGKHFGNTVNVMEQIIQERYKSYQHHLTHFTTNLTPEELRERYGQRVFSRLNEMCNVIIFPASSVDWRMQ